jgi:hypothetical protein
MTFKSSKQRKCVMASMNKSKSQSFQDSMNEKKKYVSEDERQHKEYVDDSLKYKNNQV